MIKSAAYPYEHPEETMAHAGQPQRFTMNLDRELHSHLMSTSNDGGVTAADTIRALLIIRRENAALAQRTLQMALELHAKKTGTVTH